MISIEEDVRLVDDGPEWPMGGSPACGGITWLARYGQGGRYWGHHMDVVVLPTPNTSTSSLPPVCLSTFSSPPVW
jgi:hypothetical protein